MGRLRRSISGRGRILVRTLQPDGLELSVHDREYLPGTPRETIIEDCRRLCPGDLIQLDGRDALGRRVFVWYRWLGMEDDDAMAKSVANLARYDPAASADDRIAAMDRQLTTLAEFRGWAGIFLGQPAPKGGHAP